MFKAAGVVTLALISVSAQAAPEVYNIDPTHTHPSFEATHMWGLSTWRGRFDSTRGKVTLDRTRHSGEMQITVDTGSIDFGYGELDKDAKGPEMFDVAKFPTATYHGKFSKFDGERPTEVQGELTLHGVTKPLTLVINRFKCLQNPVTKQQVCGADASATMDRADFGINIGQDHGYNMEVKLAIQVEAIKAD
jgi:polyisoprenoid-binding protein YceI